METITNTASSVLNTASNLVFGQPAKSTETTGNETGGKEPVSGEQGKGTANEPFDKGNSENPVDTSSKTNTSTESSKDTSVSGNTSYKQDDFLKLNPTLGKPTSTESSTDTNTGGTGESSLPIIPLNPDAATSSSSTGATDKADVSDKLWKPTALDEVKPEGAPGAGPSAPSDYTVATPELSTSTPNKAEEPATKATSTSESGHDTSAPKKESAGTPAVKEPPKEHSVGSDIDKILESQPKSKHTVDDSEASDPHSKMTGKTVRQTDASQHGETGNTKSLASEKVGAGSEHKASADPSSSTSEEKSGKKMSELKDKLKNKLHIGSKDK